MYRSLLSSLDLWAKNPQRKPLLLYGARQVGKTWLLKELGRTRFESFVHVDFLKEAGLRSLFLEDLDPKRIISELELRRGTRINPEATLLILDEIQEAPRALTSLKYFCEEAREYHVAAAGSYLGIELHEGETFPVGKVDSFTLRPLSFTEFLMAMGEEMLADAICRGDLGLVSRSAKERVERMLREYLVVGGMPEVVSAFAESTDFLGARDIQLQILADFEGDFGKHAPARLVERMRMVWRSVPSQLARENRRFVYGAVRKGARAKDLEEAIQWLRDYGVVTKVPRVKALSCPLSGYEDLAAFKLYALDVGLLGALSELPPAIVLDGSRLFTEFKGALTEQYVLQELLAQGRRPFYWSAERATAEVDFAIDEGSGVIPLEVKASENLKAKSLRVARETFDLQRCVRTSLSAYRDERWIANVPLWGLSQLARAYAGACR